MGRPITQVAITMALMATLITRDLTGAIGIGLTGTGATIEKVPSGSLSPRQQLQSILDGGTLWAACSPI